MIEAVIGYFLTLWLCNVKGVVLLHKVLHLWLSVM